VDELRQKLAPLTDWIPSGIRDVMPVEAWWGIMVAVLLLLLILFWVLLRGLFRGKNPSRVTDLEVIENLAEYPPLTRPPGTNVATVYNVPARLRLVIVAPVGKAMTVNSAEIEAMLDLIVPGLGQAARDDKPRVLVWSSQISHHGFGSTFHRTTIKPEAEGQPSHWVLVAGRAQVGKFQIALGLGLWAEKPNTVGRLNLEMNQWLDVIRLRSTK
jgi:hypothetical protein